MKDNSLKYLSDILHSIELIEDFTKTILTYDEYIADKKTQSAVERQLGIIGEAVTKYDTLDLGNRLENARRIIGFRNRLIHAYDAIDNSMVWAILRNHIQTLKTEVEDVLNQHSI